MPLHTKKGKEPKARDDIKCSFFFPCTAFSLSAFQTPLVNLAYNRTQ